MSKEDNYARKFLYFKNFLSIFDKFSFLIDTNEYLILNVKNKIPIWSYGVCGITYYVEGICSARNVGQCSIFWNFDTLNVVKIDQTNPNSPSINI